MMDELYYINCTVAEIRIHALWQNKHRTIHIQSNQQNASVHVKPERAMSGNIEN